jgi:hypothetical protein
MDRSRADDVLREWSTVAKTARRPFSSPKPRLTRTALPAGLLAMAAVVLVAVLVFGLGSRSNQPVASGSPTPSASATASASSSASGIGPITSPSATATASQMAGTPAGIVASVPNCDIANPYDDSPPVVSGGDMFIECASPDTGAEVIARVNLTTNQVVKTYPNNYPINVLRGFAVAGGALWIRNDNGSGCSLPCTGFTHLLRVDLVSGNVTRDLVDTILEGVGPGYVLAGDIKSGLDLKLDPATGDSKGQVPSALAGAEEVCGSLWFRDNNNADNTTSFKRLDPAGKVLASFTEPGTVGDLQQVGNECWAVEDAYSLSPDKPGPDRYQFVRVAATGIDFRSPNLPDNTRGAIFDGTFWMLTPGAADPNSTTNSNPLTTMQRVDPATWRPAGTVWTYPGLDPAFAAGGSLWAAQAGSLSPALDRLDVPLGAIGS